MNDQDFVVLYETHEDGLIYTLAVRRVDPATFDVPHAGYMETVPKVYVEPEER